MSRKREGCQYTEPLHLQEVIFLFAEEFKELEERRRREADDVLVVPVDFPNQQATEALQAGLDVLSSLVINGHTWMAKPPARSIPSPLLA